MNLFPEKSEQKCKHYWYKLNDKTLLAAAEMKHNKIKKATSGEVFDLKIKELPKIFKT